MFVYRNRAPRLVAQLALWWIGLTGRTTLLVEEEGNLWSYRFTEDWPTG